MSYQEYLDFLEALQRVEAEYLTSPEKARELLRDEGFLPRQDDEPAPVHAQTA